MPEKNSRITGIETMSCALGSSGLRSASEDDSEFGDTESSRQILKNEGRSCNSNSYFHDKNNIISKSNVSSSTTTNLETTSNTSSALKPVKTNQTNMPNWLESIQLDKLEELLKSDDYCKKGKLDRMDEGGMTLLHRSILANRFEVVQLLIHNGANTSLASRDGWSAIHLAAYVGNLDILGVLLKSN